MKIIHTADWHIGQLFHEYDRTIEHRDFLDWLCKYLNESDADVLLISGDIFDHANPSATSMKLFYSFLNKATTCNPHLQIIVTAGNHDSASRLEAPKPLIESSNIHIVGVVEKTSDGKINYEKIAVPLKNRANEIKGWCIAAPFLKKGDYPQIKDCEKDYSEGIKTFYEEALQFIKNKNDNTAIIAMGHLHAQNATTSDSDKVERTIVGGVECLSAEIFKSEICYVALGHIHKAQRIGGAEHIRYCGSPLPMSFSEINYKHQLIVFDINDGIVSNINPVEVPVSVNLKSVPASHKILEEVLTEIEMMDPYSGHQDYSPYLQIKVLANGPDPSRRHRIEEALKDKKYRFVRIDIKHPEANKRSLEVFTKADLDNLDPVTVFKNAYSKKYNAEAPETLLKMFNNIRNELNENYSA